MTDLTCDFTSDDIDANQRALNEQGLDTPWECSRRVWDRADGQYCIWHARASRKPANELNTQINDGELVGAIAGYSTDLSSFTFPEGAILIGSDLCDVDLSDADLSDTCLFNANLCETTLTNADLSNTHLGGANLSNAELSNADLSGSDLSRANLTEAKLSGANLTDVVLHRATLTGVKIRWVSKLDYRSVHASGAPAVSADLSNIDLRGANLSEAYLMQVDFSNSDLRNTDLSGATLSNADLSGAYLNNVDLTGADLSDIDLTDADLSNSTLTDANLERATLVGVDLFDADLTRIKPYGARLDSIQINDGTVFNANKSTDERWYHRGPFSPPPRCGYDPTCDPSNQDSDTREEKLIKAADTYGQFEELARKNTRPSLQSSMFVLRQDMQRKLYGEKGQYLQAYANRLFRIVFKHGESFSRIVLTAIFVIGLFAGLYWQGDFILQNPELATDGTPYIDSFLDALYFSTLTFTTLGLGDFQPVPTAQLGRALVLIEAATGAVLIATFVFVLGRRAAR